MQKKKNHIARTNAKAIAKAILKLTDFFFFCFAVVNVLVVAVVFKSNFRFSAISNQ